MEYQMTNAYVLIIERKGSSPRFYASHDPKRVKSAWCLAGAKLFQTGTGVKDGIQAVEAHLTEKGISFRRVTIAIAL